MRKIQIPSELGCLSPACTCHSNSFQLLPYLETPQCLHFIHPDTLWQSPINTLHLSRDCSPEVSEMSSCNSEGVLLVLLPLYLNEQQIPQDTGTAWAGRLREPRLSLHARPGLWACFCKCHRLGPRASLKTRRKEITWTYRKQAWQ